MHNLLCSGISSFEVISFALWFWPLREAHQTWKFAGLQVFSFAETWPPAQKALWKRAAQKVKDGLVESMVSTQGTGLQGISSCKLPIWFSAPKGVFAVDLHAWCRVLTSEVSWRPWSREDSGQPYKAVCSLYLWFGQALCMALLQGLASLGFAGGGVQSLWLWIGSHQWCAFLWRLEDWACLELEGEKPHQCFGGKKRLWDCQEGSFGSYVLPGSCLAGLQSCKGRPRKREKHGCWFTESLPTECRPSDCGWSPYGMALCANAAELRWWPHQGCPFEKRLWFFHFGLHESARTPSPAFSDLVQTMGKLDYRLAVLLTCVFSAGAVKEPDASGLSEVFHFPKSIIFGSGIAMSALIAFCIIWIFSVGQVTDFGLWIFSCLDLDFGQLDLANTMSISAFAPTDCFGFPSFFCIQKTQNWFVDVADGWRPRFARSTCRRFCTPRTLSAAFPRILRTAVRYLQTGVPTGVWYQCFQAQDNEELGAAGGDDAKYSAAQAKTQATAAENSFRKRWQKNAVPFACDQANNRNACSPRSSSPALLHPALVDVCACKVQCCSGQNTGHSSWEFLQEAVTKECSAICLYIYMYIHVTCWYDDTHIEFATCHWCIYNLFLQKNK